MTQNFRSAHSRDNMNILPLSRLVTFLDVFFRRLAFTAIFLYRSPRRRFEDTTYTKYITQVEIIPLVSQKHDQSCIYFLSGSLFKGSGHIGRMSVGSLRCHGQRDICYPKKSSLAKFIKIQTIETASRLSETSK